MALCQGGLPMLEIDVRAVACKGEGKRQKCWLTLLLDTFMELGLLTQEFLHTRGLDLCTLEHKSAAEKEALSRIQCPTCKLVLCQTIGADLKLPELGDTGFVRWGFPEVANPEECPDWLGVGNDPSDEEDWQFIQHQTGSLSSISSSSIHLFPSKAKK